MGIPGLLLFLGMLIGGFRWLLKSYGNLPDGLSRKYLMAVMGQMVGIGFAAIRGDYIIPTYHNGGLVMFSATVYSWLAWGLAVAHMRINGRQDYGSLDIHSELEYAGPVGSVSGLDISRYTGNRV
jgi:hypothetical protein